MALCARCGSENPEGFAFCGNCGTPLGASREVRKRVTIVFCDLSGSTAFGERLDPEAVRATMRRYYEQSRGVLERHGGTVEKFIGDAVMAVFGVPQAHEDDALRAVRAAVELRSAVGEIGLQARIGVNSGEVVAGEGDSLVTGDAVNVAARLEQSADPGEILIGHETYQLVRDAVQVEPVALELKGKRATVNAHRLLHVDPDSEGLVRRLDSPLVGRSRELQRLRDDFEHVLAQRSSYLFSLLGAPGVGKSRLVEEFVGTLAGRARVVRGRCLHYGEGITYSPLVDVLLQLGADAAGVVDLPTPADAAVAARKLLEAEAHEQPLVVVWDDIQWAEPVFLDLIEHIADWSRGAPIFLLCVARPELLDLRPAWGGGKPNATSLLLESLGDLETSALIDNLLGTSTLEDATRARIMAASDGNPLFVEEMLLMLADGHGDGDGEVVVPPTIHALLQARLDRLAADERSVIERGAVEGEIFHRSPVAELTSERVRNGIDGHLAKLIRTELIRPETARMPGDDAFRFRHLLIRDAAYDSLPKETRADLHERFAVWLDEHVQLVEQDEVVGYHLEQAALYRRELGKGDATLERTAASRLGTAGQGALRRGDNSAAGSLLERAVSLLPPGDEARLELVPDLVLALIDLGRIAAGHAYVEELSGAGEERWDAYAATLKPVLDTIGGTGAFETGTEALAAAQATFERLGDERGLALALVVQGHREWTRCRASAAAVHYRAALPHAERARRTSIAAEAIANLCSIAAFGPTHVDEADREIEELLEHRGTIGAETSAYRAMARAAAVRGDFDTARELVQRGREALLDAGLVLYHAASAMGAAFVEMQAGADERAAELFREGFERLAELGEHAYSSTVAANYASLMFRLGDYDETRSWLETARRLCPPGDVGTLVAADLTEGLLLVATGKIDEGSALVERGARLAETTDFWEFRGKAREATAEMLTALGRTAEARDALAGAIEVYRAKGAVVPEQRVRKRLAEL